MTTKMAIIAKKKYLELYRQSRIQLYRFLLEIQKKSSPPGLEPGIFWFVARRRDHWATRNRF